MRSLTCYSCDLPADGALKAGLAYSISNKQLDMGAGWQRLYDLSYFVAFFITGVSYWLLSTAFPPDKASVDSSEDDGCSKREYDESSGMP